MNDLLRPAVPLLAAAILTVMGLWLTRRTSRLRHRPERARRMPVMMPVIGVLFLVVGALMSAVVFGEDMPLGARITALGLLAAGVMFLVFHHNFFVDAGPDELRWRTVLGRDRVIRYSDIVEYRSVVEYGQPKLIVKSATGAKLRINPGMYDVDGLLAQIRFHQEHGRWALRGELPLRPADPRDGIPNPGR